jgi:hypothetical protein
MSYQSILEKHPKLQCQLKTLIGSTIKYNKNPDNRNIEPISTTMQWESLLKIYDDVSGKWVWKIEQCNTISNYFPNEEWSFYLDNNSLPPMPKKILHKIQYINDDCNICCPNGHAMIILSTDFIEHLGYSNCYCDKCPKKSNMIFFGERWCCPICKYDTCFQCVPKSKTTRLSEIIIESCNYETTDEEDNSQKIADDILKNLHEIKCNPNTHWTDIRSRGQSKLKTHLKNYRLNMKSVNNWIGNKTSINDVTLMHDKIILCKYPFNIDLEYYDENGSSDIESIIPIIAYGVLSNRPNKTCDIIKYIIMQSIAHDKFSLEAGDENGTDEVSTETCSIIMLYLNCLLYYCKERIPLDIINLSIILIEEHELPFSDKNILQEISIGLYGDTVPLRPDIKNAKGYIAHFMCLASRMEINYIFEKTEDLIKFCGSTCKKLDIHLISIKDRYKSLKLEYVSKTIDSYFVSYLSHDIYQTHISKKLKLEKIIINDLEENILSKILLNVIFDYNEVFIRKKVNILSLVCTKWWKYLVNKTPFNGKKFTMYMYINKYNIIGVYRLLKIKEQNIKSKTLTWL